MSKGVSLDIIRKCLEKVKSWASKKFDDCYSNKGDFEKPDTNNLVNLGFYRYHGGITNGPDVLSSTSDNYGLISTISNKDYISQLVFSLNNRNNQMICYRSGITKNIADKQWLYFHGSTSPNIPVLKKKTITGNTDKTGNIRFSESPIILSAYSNASFENMYSYICIPWINSSGKGYIRIVNSKTNDLVIEDSVGNLTVYYLEIPSGYEIPDTTTASLDEPEDDTGFSPQTNENSLNENFKQFKGDLINE